ncbi:MAG: hypothetical protein KAX49_12635 [Halanaerobiales bacterium]|nr:hypothetical protein [Halanaerobiales bacterium]
MKFIKYISILILILLVFSGCSNREYHLFLTGFQTIPKTLVINEPAIICVFYQEAGTPDLVKEFHWQVEGFDDDLVTDGGILRDIVFTTPGTKNIVVSTEFENSSVVTNELHFVVNVESAE